MLAKFAENVVLSSAALAVSGVDPDSEPPMVIAKYPLPVALIVAQPGAPTTVTLLTPMLRPELVRYVPHGKNNSSPACIDRIAALIAAVSSVVPSPVAP